jgi:hypothetical protein
LAAQLASVRVGQLVFVLVVGAVSELVVRLASATAGPSVSEWAVAAGWALVGESVPEGGCAAHSGWWYP